MEKVTPKHRTLLNCPNPHPKNTAKLPTPTLQNLKIPRIEIPVINMYNIKHKTNGEIQ